MELGWTLPKRKELIQRLKQEPNKKTAILPFQGRLQEFPRHQIPISFPKYRLDNGRTRSAQAEWLALNPDAPKDIFTADLESQAAQLTQHKILTGMFGKGEKELLRYFRKHEQTDPIILTELGFVLNGNRRLSAMRELIKEDSSVYGPKFGNIEVIILPPAEERELDQLEARLQISEDIKAEYSWTAKAFMLRTRREEHKFSDAELSGLYEMPIGEVRDLLDMLSLAESYLEDRGKARQFKLVDKSEFAFRQLKKARERFKTESEKQIFQKLSYVLIDAPTGGRVYSSIPDVAKNFEAIVSTIRQDIAAGAAAKVSQAASLLGVKAVSIDPVTEVIENEDNFAAIREIVSDAIDAQKLKEKEKAKGAKAEASLEKAADLLLSALKAWDKSKSKKKLAAQVASIEGIVAKLKAKIDGDAKD